MFVWELNSQPGTSTQKPTYYISTLTVRLIQVRSLYRNTIPLVLLFSSPVLYLY